MSRCSGHHGLGRTLFREPSSSFWGARASLAHCGSSSVAVVSPWQWECSQLLCNAAAAKLGPIKTVAIGDLTVPLQPWAQRRVSWGWRALWRGRRGCGAGCGLVAELGWEGKRPGAGSSVLHTQRKREQHCPLRDSCCWLGTCVHNANMVSPARFLGDN